MRVVATVGVAGILLPIEPYEVRCLRDDVQVCVIHDASPATRVGRGIDAGDSLPGSAHPADR